MVYIPLSAAYIKRARTFSPLPKGGAWRAVRAVCLVLILVFVIEYIFCLCKLHF